MNQKGSDPQSFELVDVKITIPRKGNAEIVECGGCSGNYFVHIV
jgi:hypothetical protein